MFLVRSIEELSYLCILAYYEEKNKWEIELNMGIAPNHSEKQIEIH